LASAAIPDAGSGLIDAPDAAFSPILASALDEIFELKIQKRLGIPKTYREGSYFEELRQENGTVRDSKLVMDGTDFGITLEYQGSFVKRMAQFVIVNLLWMEPISV